MGNETSHFKSVTFDSDSVIFNEGSQCDNVFLISEGKVRIVKGESSTYPKVLGTLGKGEVIGEMALLDNHPHIATARAVKKTKLLTISRDEFTKRVNEMDPVMRGIVMMLVKRNRQMADELMIKKESVRFSGWDNKRQAVPPNYQP